MKNFGKNGIFCSAKFSSESLEELKTIVFTIGEWSLYLVENEIGCI